MPPRTALADPASVALAEAFVAHAEGDAATARERAAVVRDASDALDAGTTAARLDWLAALEAPPTIDPPDPSGTVPRGGA